MAYTATVTKQSVKKERDDDLFTITIEMEVVDDATSAVVFTKSVSARYNSGTNNLTELKNRLQDSLADAWDKWSAENSLYTATAFDDLVTNLQTAANTYINQ